MSERATIRLVVFDLGRVLIRICDDWLGACRAVGIPLEDSTVEPSGLLRLRDLVHRVEVNDLPFETFADQVAEILRTNPERIRQASSRFVEGVYPGVVELIDRLNRAGVATACLTNTNEHHWGLLSDPAHPANFPLDRLSHRFASHELRVRKPESEIYACVERATGRSGPEILFFDDVRENIDAAAVRGWHVVQIDPEQNDPIGQIRRALREFRLPTD